MNLKSKIFIAGINGMVGSAIRRKLEGYKNIVGLSRSGLDLTDKNKVYSFFEKHRPEYVFLAAAKVGGIKSNNTYPVEFLNDNLAIQSNVINTAYDFNVRKLLFLGSSCIYPKFAKQPIKESEFMSGRLEKTNDAYAIAKIAGIKLCQAYRDEYDCNYISVMPTNLYGAGDKYDEFNSHVLPALIDKIHKAKTARKSKITLWGTGVSRREFLFVDDLAEACILLMNTYHERDIINVGSGTDLTIKSLATKIAKAIGYKGKIEFDGNTAMDGTPVKKLDSSRIRKYGWKATTSLDDGIKIAYADYLQRFQ